VSLHLSVRRGMAVVVTAAAAMTAVTAGGAATAAPRPDAATVKRQVEALREQAEQATEEYNGSREKLESVGVMIKAATTRVQLQQQAVDVARKALGRIAAETYKAGDLELVSLLLDDNPESVLAASGLRSTLGERQAGALAQLVAAQQRLTADQATLARQQKDLSAEITRLGKLKNTIKDKLDSAERLLARLDGSERRAIERLSSTMNRDDLETAGIKVPATGLLRCEDVGIVTSSSRVRAVLDFACDQIGKPYQWGADGPGSYDCSGLILASWAKAGVSLPHNAAMQAREGTTVSQSTLQPGDLLFFNGYNHAGIYIGKGLMVHAPHTGDVVRIASARLDGRLIKAVRI